MTAIDFYVNATERERIACRLAAKSLAQGRRMLVLAPDPELARRLDRLMWTWPATGFVPHCMVSDPLAAQTPVLIAAAPEAAPSCSVLLNLGSECPPGFERYERVLEIVSGDAEDRRLARLRYGWYRDRGYAIRTHDLTARAGA